MFTVWMVFCITTCLISWTAQGILYRKIKKRYYEKWVAIGEPGFRTAISSDIFKFRKFQRTLRYFIKGDTELDNDRDIKKLKIINKAIFLLALIGMVLFICYIFRTEAMNSGYSEEQKIMYENGLIQLTGAVFMLVALLFGLLNLFRLFFGYEITTKSIRVLLFHKIPICIVPFSKIEKIYSAKFHEVAIVPGLHFSSRIFGKRVVLRTKGIWFKFIFLTPKDPNLFIQETRKQAPSIEQGEW